MAARIDRNSISLPVASSVNPKTPVRLVAGGGVAPCATSNVEPFGYSRDATGIQGENLTVYEEGGVGKFVAAASVGAGADVCVGSSNGALAPLAAASGVLQYKVGKSLTAAAAGEVFTAYVRIRQIGANA